MNREQRITLAEETLRIAKAGGYPLPGQPEVQIAGAIANCMDKTQMFLPDELAAMLDRAVSHPAMPPACIDVRNESTLAGAARLASTAAGRRIAVLNFASARNPGGGFLNGSQAQEESLARSSALYLSLVTQMEFYEYHRKASSLLYSDRMILSPGCPVFRDDAGELIAPYLVDVITSPAPNAGAIAQNQPQDSAKVPEVLARRAALVLALAAHAGAEAIVLGAWGCGVFKNDPGRVAGIFQKLLAGPFANRFPHVVFSVLDQVPGQPSFQAFKEALAR